MRIRETITGWAVKPRVEIAVRKVTEEQKEDAPSYRVNVGRRPKVLALFGLTIMDFANRVGGGAINNLDSQGHTEDVAYDPESTKIETYSDPNDGTFFRPAPEIVIVFQRSGPPTQPS